MDLKFFRIYITGILVCLGVFVGLMMIGAAQADLEWPLQVVPYVVGCLTVWGLGGALFQIWTD